MNAPITVTSLSTQIKSLLETTFMDVYVEGEISNLTYHSSGHIYFSIKDDKSTMSCVMFRGNTKYLKFKLEVGLKINIRGSLTVYTPRGSYQLICNRIEPSGQGALALAYEQLKEKLKQKGYFDPSIKKNLPKYPKKIALVTSPTGAAIQDMLKVANHRWNLVEFILVPTLVQGETAKDDIAKSIKYADTLNCDIIIVGRGGGSIEDLWAFNEEIVANAIYEAQTVIISAVGHEVDFLISDFVADVRAATPSNAIEIALPDTNEHRIYIDTLTQDFENRLKNILYSKEQNIIHLKRMYEQNSIETKFNLISSEIKMLKLSFDNRFSNILNSCQNSISLLKNSFEHNSPEKKHKKGFVQISKDNKIIELENINIGDNISLQTPTHIANAKIENIKKQ
ncbi:exodeoxyribonuclease VII large subunit [Malaciobacter molluscorum LMG 25693]|uniref:Exodeoxyribonuclease 7 large subunit n=1 Tax=Malaciobacter molluscorum LMG 25693 TaxID=870501 RepID=A0A2G1DGF8_9BACT|nr:exodeoxyribonuclease VII large subunit [Malaciobacter molluscorum]AXX91492.1 exodeoxyribonuclease VII, large subunit [Malaciobacter molluscorum LMG 25693]PHO17578.1 exodeoxyribonuclease VII large subunit [Malaciobacter molluscorum LMG 25693]RXJ93391.1 exodeoxyribonuclease VII large subunit [Malaciobacter molluscorum]